MEFFMFEVGDYIIYGNSGVCKVTDVGPIDIGGEKSGRLYYTMIPCFSQDGKIFTPVDNDKILMRSVIDKENAIKLIDDIKNIEDLWIADEKKREYDYKEAIKTCEPREMIKIIKTIYKRKQSRIAAGKKITASDEKYFKLAENSLYGELAITFEMTKDEAKEFVVKRVEGIE